MQQRGRALTLIFPNRSPVATYDFFKSTHTLIFAHTFFFLTALRTSYSLRLPLSPPHFDFLFSHHLLLLFISSPTSPLSSLCFSVSTPFLPHPCGCFPAAPAVLLQHSVYMNLGLTHCLLACLLWYVLETENRIELCWACSTAPFPGEMEDILHSVNLLLFRQADFYFGLCRFPVLRHFYCIIRRQG